MFAHMIDGFKEKAGSALQLTSLATAVAVAGFVTLSFLCAAAFVYVLQTYGLIQACLTGAGIFLLVALVAAGFYVARRNRAEEQAQARKAETAKSAVHTALADPMLVAAGIQVIRAIGVKKLIPILAVGGLALGLLASRHASADEAPAE
jgi:heme/copper-type cytochrome/quinol oxidase subunit 2